MSISTMIGTRLLSGIGALALVGGLAGGTAIAAKGDADKPSQELRHELRDQTKSERDAIKQLRSQLAAEYAKDQPDVSKMKQLHAQIEAKRDAIEAVRFGAFLAMHEQLDAAQRERVAARMAGKGKHGERKHAKADGERGHAKAKDKGKGKGKDKGKDKGKGKPDKDKREG
ncbi:Spy/CpxP family protein refolding chaperone [Enhygromyxa salina]|uniref:Uncharacterized protein n=1 Tax=Enhygromyxa salina TaxID=215803 RepID=A0A2S9XWM0_9BACT|nr:periplasmic heavy metal sensor [Enhygromyxa salina]PRP97130.1 hypothetical protein ENSA7_67420 [Enhygromyxa salina]